VKLKFLAFSFCCAVLWLTGLWMLDEVRNIVGDDRLAVGFFLAFMTLWIYGYSIYVRRFRKFQTRLLFAIPMPLAACGVFLFLWMFFPDLELSALGLMIFGPIGLVIFGWHIVLPLILVTAIAHYYFDRMITTFENEPGAADGDPAEGG